MIHTLMHIRFTKWTDFLPIWSLVLCCRAWPGTSLNASVRSQINMLVRSEINVSTTLSPARRSILSPHVRTPPTYLEYPHLPSRSLPFRQFPSAHINFNFFSDSALTCMLKLNELELVSFLLDERTRISLFSSRWPQFSISVFRLKLYPSMFSFSACLLKFQEVRRPLRVQAQVHSDSNA